MNSLDKPYRHRYIFLIIKLAVVLLAFLSAKDVKTTIYYVFKAKVSCKTICQWAKKFPVKIPNKKIKYKEDETVILFTDEKFTWIKKIKAYWWSVKDQYGNVLASIITKSRNAASAEKLFRRAKLAIEGTVHAIVHDGLKSYDKPTKKIFGRKCKSIVAGIKGKFVMINKRAFWITNNSAESLNSEIDSYLARHQYNFNNLESANYFADLFLFRRNLRQSC